MDYRWVSKDDFVWYLMRRMGKSGTQRCHACYGRSSDHECGSFVVTIHYGDDIETGMVFQTGYPPQGN